MSLTRAYALTFCNVFYYFPLPFVNQFVPFGTKKQVLPPGTCQMTAFQSIVFPVSFS